MLFGHEKWCRSPQLQADNCDYKYREHQHQQNTRDYRLEDSNHRDYFAVFPNMGQLCIIPTGVFWIFISGRVSWVGMDSLADDIEGGVLGEKKVGGSPEGVDEMDGMDWVDGMGISDLRI